MSRLFFFCKSWEKTFIHIPITFLAIPYRPRTPPPKKSLKLKSKKKSIHHVPHAFPLAPGHKRSNVVRNELKSRIVQAPPFHDLQNASIHRLQVAKNCRCSFFFDFYLKAHSHLHKAVSVMIPSDLISKTFNFAEQTFTIWCRIASTGKKQGTGPKLPISASKRITFLSYLYF